MFFFFQAEDGIRDLTVTGVQTCALPIFSPVVPFCVSVAGLYLWTNQPYGDACPDNRHDPRVPIHPTRSSPPFPPSDLTDNSSPYVSWSAAPRTGSGAGACCSAHRTPRESAPPPKSSAPRRSRTYGSRSATCGTTTCATCTARCFDGPPPGRRPAAHAPARPVEPPGGDPRRDPAPVAQCRAVRRRDGRRFEADREPRPQDAAAPPSPERVSRRHRPRYCPAALWWRPRPIATLARWG